MDTERLSELIDEMKYRMQFELRSRIVGLLLLLVVTTSGFSQGESSKSIPLLEIILTGCAQDCDVETTRIYSDGRYRVKKINFEMGKSGRRRKVVSTEEKQLEPEEIAELIAWAEEPDFLNAESEYVVKVVRDWPSNFTITYRNKGREKKVQVFNFNAGNAEEKARVPAAVMKLARWAQPYAFGAANGSGQPLQEER